jgi:hypothetical protein
VLYVVADSHEQFRLWCWGSGWPVPDRGIRMLLPRERDIQGIHFEPGDLLIELESIYPMETDGEGWRAWHMLRQAKRFAGAGLAVHHRPTLGRAEFLSGAR